MTNVFKLPLVVTILAGLITVLSLLAVYREVNYRDFDLNLKSSSLVFNLKNNRYIEVTPLNDHITSIFGSVRQNPFTANDVNGITAYGLDLGPINRSYIDNSSSEAGNRVISINRIDAHNLVLDFDIHVSYPADNYRYYTVQIDYSGVPQVYPISRGMRLVDRGCTVDLTDNQTATYTTFNEDRTIMVNIPYSPVMKFKIAMYINCNQ